MQLKLLRQEENMERSDVLKKIKEARESSKPRGFKQTWDFSIVVKGINLKKPENRFSADLTLPNGRGKGVKIAAIVDTLASEAKGKADLIIKKDEIEALAKNKKKFKKIASEYTFLGEASLMPTIGKFLGAVLGPRGKLPRPVPPKIKIEPFIAAAQRSVKVSLKENPVLNMVIGSEEMDDEKLAANLEAAYNFVKEKLPKGENSIKKAYIKLTMGKPVRLEV
jgi:large subunit ribosomal protein L1